jgi:hypothetical protein
MAEFQLVIDCPPGTTRPDDIAKQVLDGTGIILGNTTSRLFGEWTWDIPVEYSEQYRTNQKLIGERLTSLYHNGFIRHAEW